MENTNPIVLTKTNSVSQIFQKDIEIINIEYNPFDFDTIWFECHKINDSTNYNKPYKFIDATDFYTINTSLFPRYTNFYIALSPKNLKPANAIPDDVSIKIYWKYLN
jgi:hypothetical protein